MSTPNRRICNTSLSASTAPAIRSERATPTAFLISQGFPGGRAIVSAYTALSAAIYAGMATYATALGHWRHTLPMPATPPPPAPIPPMSTLDPVVSALDSVIEWSIAASSRLGYFAALYKRITIAVRTAVNNGAFQDGPRMERFDASFAGRYFDALNGYFHPNQFPRPTRSWQKTFDAADRVDLIILQHMLGGVNAHIELDLEITAQ